VARLLIQAATQAASLFVALLEAGETLPPSLSEDSSSVGAVLKWFLKWRVCVGYAVCV